MELPKRLPTTSQYINESKDLLLGNILKEFPEADVDYYQSDLHILYDKKIHDWLKANYKYPENLKVMASDVKGQPWYGKRFIEIPFVVDKEAQKVIDKRKK